MVFCNYLYKDLRRSIVLRAEQPRGWWWWSFLSTCYTTTTQHFFSRSLFFLSSSSSSSSSSPSLRFCSPYSVLWPLIRSHTLNSYYKKTMESHTVKLFWTLTFTLIQIPVRPTTKSGQKLQKFRNLTPNVKQKHFSLSILSWLLSLTEWNRTENGEDFKLQNTVQTFLCTLKKCRTIIIIIVTAIIYSTIQEPKGRECWCWWWWWSSHVLTLAG